MSWIWCIVTFFAGSLAGYMLCDALQTENRITYVIKKLKAKDGGSVVVDADATLTKEEKRKQRRDARKNK